MFNLDKIFFSIFCFAVIFPVRADDVHGDTFEVPYVMMDDLQFTEEIAEGGLAKVYKGNHNGATVAIKIFKDEHLPIGVEEERLGTLLSLKRATDAEEGLSLLMRREIEIGAQLRHPYIGNQLKVVVEENAIVGIVFKLYGSSLYDCIFDGKESYTFGDIKGWMNNIVDALEYMHLNKVAHRDIKTLNVVLDEDRNAVLIDMGQAVPIVDRRRRLTGGRGTPIYMPPEIILHQSYDERVDVYSLGMLLYELLHKQLPYNGTEDHQRLCASVAYQGHRPEVREPTCSAMTKLIKVMQACWEQDPRSRPDLHKLRAMLNDAVAPAEENILVTKHEPPPAQ